MDADPPGANNWACKPTARHPRPVVLVHGTAGNKNTNWQTYAPLLANNGYCVFALTYGVSAGTPKGLDQFGGLDAIETSAAAAEGRSWPRCASPPARARSTSSATRRAP